MKTVLYVAGRSGGHIVPLISHAKRSPDQKNIFITTNTRLDHEIVSKNKDLAHEHHAIDLENIPSLKNPIKFIKYLFSFIGSIYSCIKVIKSANKVDSLYTTGGYIGVCGSIAAFLYRIPVYVYHLDVSPGHAGRFIHRYATESLVCFTQTKKYLSRFSLAFVRVSEYPVRFDSRPDKKDARNKLGIGLDSYVLLVLGGSQGSVQVDSFVCSAVKSLSGEFKENIFIIHQTGQVHVEEVEKNYQDIGIEIVVYGYVSEIELLYASADYVVARSGAGTIAELLFFDKRSLLIPLKNVARDHQVVNAQVAASEHPDKFSFLLDTGELGSKVLCDILSEDVCKSEKFIVQSIKECDIRA